MRQIQATVAERRTFGPALWEISLHAPAGSGFRPGQFFLVAGPSYLRRALFPARCAPDGLSVLVKAAADPFIAWLASRMPGDPLDLIGPFGRGFVIPRRDERWLLVAETAADVGPLRQQIELAIAAGAEVALLTGATHTAAVFPVAELPPALELRVATADGSRGVRGSVTALLSDALPWADHVAAVGTRSLYRALQREAQTTRPTLTGESLQVLVTDVPLVCGVGACLACAVHGEHGERGVHLVCREGPVFDLDAGLACEIP